MASNLLEKGCFSYLNNCEPTSTDLGPFYPLITSLFYKFSKLPIKNLLYFQTLTHIFCCLFFVCYLQKNYKIRSYQVLFIFAFSLLNPLSIGWQRYLLPDTFSLDISLIVLSLIDSYRLKNEYKYLCFGSIFICIGSLLRYDIYLLLIPVIAIFLIKNYKEFFKKKSFTNILLLSLNLLLISSISLSFWAMRNIKLGLPPLRNSFFSFHRNINPDVIDWIKSWTINTYDLPKGVYPYTGPVDENINKNRVIPPNWALNEELKKSIKEDPLFLEDETIELASKKAKEIRSNYLLNNFNNFKRIIWIVFGPFYSGGLHLDESNYEFNLGKIKLGAVKLLNFAMRITLFFGCLKIYLNQSISKIKLLNVALIFLFFDIGFCLYLGQIEQRYLNDSILFLQFSLIFEYLNNFTYEKI